jgi:hypothetical protein
VGRGGGALRAGAHAFGPAILPAAIDVAVHEHDIRGALGRPGAHASATITITARRMADRWFAQLAERELAAPCIAARDGTVWFGDPSSPVRWTADEYDAFRAAFGRRSAAQFAATFVGADPGPYLRALLVFGLTPVDLDD